MSSGTAVYCSRYLLLQKCSLSEIYTVTYFFWWCHILPWISWGFTPNSWTTDFSYHFSSAKRSERYHFVSLKMYLPCFRVWNKGVVSSVVYCQFAFTLWNALIWIVCGCINVDLHVALACTYIHTHIVCECCAHAHTYERKGGEREREGSGRCL